MKHRILVTGGSGFLGSKLCENLVQEGHDGVCLDNLFTSQKDNITPLLGAGNFEFIRHDVTQPIWLEVDQIYNLACPAAPGPPCIPSTWIPRGCMAEWWRCALGCGHQPSCHARSPMPPLTSTCWSPCWLLAAACSWGHHHHMHTHSHPPPVSSSCS